MPKSSVRESFDLETRNKYTKVEAEVIILVEGKELPNAAVLGEALDKCLTLVREHVAESYKVVPPRVDTPVAEPYAQPPVMPSTPALVEAGIAPEPKPEPEPAIPSTFGN